jgi:MATE family multidrug resistance protein
VRFFLRRFHGATGYCGGNGSRISISLFSLVPLIVFQAYKQFADGKSETKYSMGPQSLVMSLMWLLIIFDLWDLDSFLKWERSQLSVRLFRIVMLFFMHYILIRKPKFHSYFENFSLKEIKKKC